MTTGILDAPLLKELAAEEPAIRSGPQHNAIPPWRRIPPELVCEIQATTAIIAPPTTCRGLDQANAPIR